MALTGTCIASGTVELGPGAPKTDPLLVALEHSGTVFRRAIVALLDFERPESRAAVWRGDNAPG